MSRANGLAELAGPLKAESGARYCSRWWLVVARPELVDGLVVPERWGIMAPPSGRRTRTMTVLRQAPKLKPADTGPAWRRIASWEHYRLETRIQEVEYQASRHKRDAEYAQGQLRDHQLAGVGWAHPQAANLGRLLTELEQRRWESGGFDVDATVAAILDVAAYRSLANQARSEIEYLVGEARRIAQPMARIAAELDRLGASKVREDRP